MKAWKPFVLFGLLAVLLCGAATAHMDTDIPYAVTGGNIWFEQISGSITDCDSEVSEVVIPEEIDGITVTTIGNYAFRGKDIKKIEIPHTVTRIRDGGFWNCIYLITITIPDSVERIGKNAFEACGLRRISIPGSISVIEAYTFSMCGRLLSVTIPSSVTQIKEYAFDWCDELEDVYFTGTREQWDAIEIDALGNDPLLSATIHFENSGPESPATPSPSPTPSPVPEPVVVSLSAPTFGAAIPLTVTGSGVRTVNFLTAFYSQGNHFVGVESVQKSISSGLESVFVPVGGWAFVPTVKAFALDENFRPLSPAAGQSGETDTDLPDKYVAILSESDANARGTLVDALTEREAKDFVKRFAGWLH